MPDAARKEAKACLSPGRGRTASPPRIGADPTPPWTGRSKAPYWACPTRSDSSTPDSPLQPQGAGANETDPSLFPDGFPRLWLCIAICPGSPYPGKATLGRPPIRSCPDPGHPAVPVKSKLPVTSDGRFSDAHRAKTWKTIKESGRRPGPTGTVEWKSQPSTKLVAPRSVWRGPCPVIGHVSTRKRSACWRRAWPPPMMT